MSEDLYDQEFECSFQAAITGSYYGALIEGLEAQSRVTEVPYDDNLDVETWWDLGLNDSTAIWFVQKYKGEIRLIDYYENAGYGLDHYVSILDQEELDAARSVMSEDLYDQEFECSFQAAITGSYYGALIEGLEAQSRVTEVHYDDNLDVETWWDFGLNDSKAIWCVQKYKGELRLIDYYENAGYVLDNYATM